jgi:hypothetical protein
LLVATHSNALSDGGLQELVRWELRAIPARRPELKPAIRAAYLSASAVGKQFLERSLDDVDPNLLK